MFSIDSLIIFVSAGFLLNITPGPDMIYVATRSSLQGRNAGIVSALGIGTGTIFHILAAALGLSTILMYSADAYNLIKWIGAAYLVYIGIKTIISSNKHADKTEPENISLWKIYLQGTITNILNPKVALFFLAFLPQFIDESSGSIILQIFTLGAIFNINGTLVLIVASLFFGKIGGILNRSKKIRKIQSRFTGAIFIALGVGLAISNKD